MYTDKFGRAWDGPYPFTLAEVTQLGAQLRHPGVYQISSEKAFRAGWQTRSFEETALDCLTYFRSQGDTLDWTDYLSADKEKQVLDAWAHHSS